MEKMIAPCGIVCTECPAYLATQADDNEQRAKVAKDWSKQYNADIKPESINCDGCISGARHFSHCDECPIRRCCVEKKLENCAHCEEYACEELNKFFGFVPTAKATLDKIRESLQ